MDRSIVYTQEQGRSTDFLFAQRAGMTGLAKLAEAMFGAASPIVYGLPVTPTSPATLAVNVGIGQIYSAQPVDATAYGVLPADTTDTIVKQGLLMAAQALSCPAPTTAGYSINYLIEAAYQDSDTAPVVLPYFNSANPSQPLSGQSNSGAPQATERQGLCIVAAKAGAAAATGSQTTPAADAGYTGIAIVTVAYGQTSITSSSITRVAGAPVLPAALLGMLQSSAANSAPDTGSANAYAIALSPAPAALAAGMRVTLQNLVASNTGAATLNVNGLGSLPIQALKGSSLQGGELPSGCDAVLVLNATQNAWVLVKCSGGPVAVGAPTQTSHAAQLGQFTGTTTPYGYQKFPSGMILQWGSSNGTTGGPLSVTFAIAFPNVCNVVTLAPANPAAYSAVVDTTNSSPSKTGFQLSVWSLGSSPSRTNALAYFMAIGY